MGTRFRLKSSLGIVGALYCTTVLLVTAHPLQIAIITAARINRIILVSFYIERI
jgi:hypothetical protein